MKYSIALLIGLVYGSLGLAATLPPPVPPPPQLNQNACNDVDVAFTASLVDGATRHAGDGTVTELTVADVKHLQAQVELCRGKLSTAKFCDQDAKLLNEMNSIIASQHRVGIPPSTDDYLARVKELVRRRTQFQAICTTIVLDPYQPVL